MHNFQCFCMQIENTFPISKLYLIIRVSGHKTYGVHPYPRNPLISIESAPDFGNYAQ